MSDPKDKETNLDDGKLLYEVTAIHQCEVGLYNHIWELLIYFVAAVEGLPVQSKSVIAGKMTKNVMERVKKNIAEKGPSLFDEYLEILRQNI